MLFSYTVFIYSFHICTCSYTVFGSLVAGYWEKAAHSAYGMFNLYKYLMVYLVFCHLGFLAWEFLSH